MSDFNSESGSETTINIKAQKRSIVFAIITSVAAVLSAGCMLGNILTLVAIKLGADEFLLGIVSFASIAPCAASLLTMSSIEKKGKKNVLIKWFFVGALFSLLFLLIPLMAGSWGVRNEVTLILLIIAAFMYTTVNSMASTGWFPLLQDIVPSEKVGRFFSTMRTSWQTASLVLLLFLAYFLGEQTQWWKFELIFLFGFVMQVFRALLIIPMAERKNYDDDISTPGIVKRFRELWSIKKLRTVTFYVVLYSILFSAPLPYIIKMMKSFNYGDGFVLAAVAMFNLGAIVSLKLWGKLADRFGNRPIFSISHIGMIFCTASWIIVDGGLFGTVSIFVIYFLLSIFHAGNGIVQTRYLFHNVPEDKQYLISLISTFTVFSMAVGPLLGGLFLKLTEGVYFTSGALNMNNYHIFFVITAIGFIIPHIMRRKLRVKREASTNDVMHIMSRPFRNIMGPFIRFSSKKNNY